MIDFVSSMHQNTNFTYSAMSPQEEALQSLCKQLLKSKFFRGYYEERRFVEVVSDYRDIISLHRCERDFERLLLDIKSKLELFYQYSPLIWIGITHGAHMGVTPKKHTLSTHIWLQLEEVAFGQYWFNVKSVRFRRNEVILKIKVVRAVEIESTIERITTSRSSTPAAMSNNTGERTSLSPAIDPANPIQITSHSNGERISGPSADTVQPEINEIGYRDFVNVISDWGVNIKHLVYDFLSNDINKHNIKEALKFVGLLLVSLLMGSMEVIKFLGTFTITFMFEVTRFTHVMTPIIFKILEVVNKIIGGLYLLLAIIWKDIFGNRKMPQQQSLTNMDEEPRRDLKAIEYNQPLYKSIEYNIRQTSIRPPPYRRSDGLSTEFERKL